MIEITLSSKVILYALYFNALTSPQSVMKVHKRLKLESARGQNCLTRCRSQWISICHYLSLKSPFSLNLVTFNSTTPFTFLHSHIQMVWKTFPTPFLLNWILNESKILLKILFCFYLIGLHFHYYIALFPFQHALDLRKR